MLTLRDCGEVADRICDYADGALAAEEVPAFEQHLGACPSCRASLQQYRAVNGLLAGSLCGAGLSSDFNAKTGQRLCLTPATLPSPTGQAQGIVAGPALAEEHAGSGTKESVLVRLGSAPWWAVSLVLHVLLIVLLGLITMTIGMLDHGSHIVVLTSLEKQPAAKLEEERKTPAALRDVLAKHELPATDPRSTAASNVVVPPDILERAELGDHFETLNLDRPDTQSAFGNPDARMFHSMSGSDEPEGGGGIGGTSLMDDLIGMGGAASPGAGGGWGGGNGTGAGIGTGAGHGSFGQRSGGGRKLMVMRNGGSKATESAVEAALYWLERHQGKDGGWSTSRFCEQCNGQRCTGTGTADYDAGVTGLAMLAFLGAGHSPRVGQFKETVRKAVDWVMAHQGKDGMIGNAGVSFSSYNHMIPALALTEAYAMSREARIGEAAQKAVDFVVRTQGAEGGWGFGGYLTGAGGDSTVTAWAMMVLKSAKIAGLKFDLKVLERIREFYGKCVYKVNGKAGDSGYAPYRCSYAVRDGRSNAEVVTENACAMVALQYLGEDRGSERLMGLAETLRTFKPVWDFKVKSPGFYYEDQTYYYWYYAMLGMFQMGGEYWKEWNEGLKPLLVAHQNHGGCQDGSWDPADVWGTGYGASRVYSTALGALCLEVYYRYLPLYR